MGTAPDKLVQKRERTAFLLLTVVLFPVVTIMIIASFGFAVWFWQMFVSGPPGS
ncbi:periplasmic nitrate reductase, NapE protein [Dyella sp. C9]|uniref:periplasmic nitrate reductase, NapE protein n=1 Tax=Dyella sp. C9 TaxID=2202154 RepID=UPI000DEEE867|nr:periplasmic nitrate reductase, NapE protein [Dyella sp. C9]